MIVFYVANVERGGDFNYIPISMFDEPAIFTDRARAVTFCAFANGAGSRHEVRELTLPDLEACLCATPDPTCMECGGTGRSA